MLAAALLLAGCGRSGPVLPEGGGGTPTPAASPTPLPPSLVLESVTSAAATVRAGQYGIFVEAMLTNEGADAATDVRVTLTFSGLSGDRAADFRVRERPWAGVVAPGASVTVELDVDVAPSASAAETVDVSGEASFMTGGGARTAPAEQGFSWAFEALTDLVVDTPFDVVGADGVLSLREAIETANQTTARDRVRFDPAVFAPTGQVPIVLTSELPPVTEALILDGGGAGVAIQPDVALYESELWLLRVQADAVVHAVTFLQGSELYPVFDLSTNGCNGGEQDGGAIVTDGGGAMLVLDGTVFDDTGVQRRNCFAATVRTAQGSGHRVFDSHFIASGGDAMVLYAPTIEVSRTRVIGARDDGIFIGAGSGATRLAGNLVTDVRLAGILVTGPAGSSPVEIAHGTFLRNGWGVRSFDTRPIVLRNNAFADDVTAAHGLAGGGANVTISHTRYEDGPLCEGTCPSATVDALTVTNGAIGLTLAGGTTWTDIVPAEGSALIDAAMPLFDVNGATPGAFTGTAPDIGAAERP